MSNDKNKRNSRMIFLALIVLALFYFVIPKEWIHELNPVKWKQTEIPLAYGRMVQNFSIYDSLVENKEYLLNEIRKTNMEARILQEEIISSLYGYCQKNNIAITKVIFSEIFPVNFNEEEIIEESNAVGVTVVVEFNGNFDDILNLIDDIKGDAQNIGFSHMRLLSMDGSDFMGVMELNFYAITLDKVNYEMVN